MKKIKWRNGAGEFLGAAIVTPMVLGILLYMISFFQVAVEEQNLIRLTYAAAREASICYTKEEAQTVIDNIATENGATGYVDNGRTGGVWAKGYVAEMYLEKDITTVLGIGSGIHRRYLAFTIEHSKWIDDNYR